MTVKVMKQNYIFAIIFFRYSAVYIKPNLVFTIRVRRSATTVILNVKYYFTKKEIIFKLYFSKTLHMIYILILYIFLITCLFLLDCCKYII